MRGEFLWPNVEAQQAVKPSAAATGYAWRRSRADSCQPPIELVQEFIKPRREPANAHLLLIRPGVRIDAGAIRIVLCVCQYEPPKLDYKRVNVHLFLRMHNVLWGDSHAVYHSCLSAYQVCLDRPGSRASAHFLLCVCVLGHCYQIRQKQHSQLKTPRWGRRLDAARGCVTVPSSMLLIGGKRAPPVNHPCGGIWPIVCGHRPSAGGMPRR